jgi:hypothetical protein
VPILVPYALPNNGEQQGVNALQTALGLQNFLGTQFKRMASNDPCYKNRIGQFKDFWEPRSWGGQHDFKYWDSRLDAFGNFGFGYSGTMAGIPGLLSIANDLKLGANDPQNAADIQAGINAATSGCKLIVLMR